MYDESTRYHNGFCKKIVIDKLNKNNINEIFEEYVKYASDGKSDYDFSDDQIYKILLEIKNGN